MTSATVNIVHHVTTCSLGSIGERQNEHSASYCERCGSFQENSIKFYQPAGCRMTEDSFIYLLNLQLR